MSANGWRIDAKVSLGDLIKIGLLVIGLLAAYFTMDSRVSAVECSSRDLALRQEEARKETVTRREHDLSLKNIESQVSEINRRLGVIETEVLRR